MLLFVQQPGAKVVPSKLSVNGKVVIAVQAVKVKVNPTEGNTVEENGHVTAFVPPAVVADQLVVVVLLL